MALGTAASRGSGSVSSELLLSTSALLASSLTLICSSQGGLSCPESVCLGPGRGYSPSPNPRRSHGLRGHRAGPTRPPPPTSSCPALILRVHPQVKQLRLEREREKAMREQELEMLQREKEAEHFKTWEEQEDNFHLQQAKLRYSAQRGGCPPHHCSPVPCIASLHLPVCFWMQTHRVGFCPRAFALAIHAS